MSITELKELGNAAFKESKFQDAIEYYSKAILTCMDKDLKGTLLSNRAAANLKLNQYENARQDAEESLQLTPTNNKSLYRLSMAYYKLKDYKKAIQHVTRLLSIEPKNQDAKDLIRDIRTAVNSDTSSAIGDLLQSYHKNELKLLDTLSGLIGLIADDKSHAIDFVRKGGLQLVNEQIVKLSADRSQDYSLIINKCIRCIAASCIYPEFVNSFVDIHHPNPIQIKGSMNLLSTDNKKLYFQAFIVNIMKNQYNSPHITSSTRQTAISACIHILKHIPLTVDDKEIRDDDNLDLYLQENTGKLILNGLLSCILTFEPELFSLATEAFTAFLSEQSQYINQEIVTDKRLETLQERKKRLHQERMLHKRMITHAIWALEVHYLEGLLQAADSENAHMRLRSSICISRLANAIDDMTILHSYITPYISITENLIPGGGVVTVPSSLYPETLYTYHPIELMHRRAILESALFACRHQELAVNTLKQYDGVKQLLTLVSSGEGRCQEVASEVMCLAAASENGSVLLSTLLSSGALQTLLQSPSPNIRAAAASTMTKLTIKAKALQEETTELSDILNTVLHVLKSSPLSTLKSSATTTTNTTSVSTIGTATGDDFGKVKTGSKDGLVSFSKHQSYDTNVNKINTKEIQHKHEIETLRIHGGKASKTSASGVVDSQQNDVLADFTKSLNNVEEGNSIVSTERAIEVLASLVGKTFIKEEIVHGSYRVAPSIQSLLALDLDMRSTAAYGLAHILASLTVSNHELRAKALADKGMSDEQYNKLQELSRLKTKDEYGNVLEEKKEETDPDSDDLAKRRIQKIVNYNGIPVLLKLIENASNQTREAAARALRQICSIETNGSRGLIIQHGGLKTCTSVAMDVQLPKNITLESAHIIAKTLITTNPTLLPDHIRLGCISPLIKLCKDSEVTNLQLFESLMALTNLTSCGIPEQTRIQDEKGISTLYYLMFNDHPMIRRAATEALCNMATHEGVLKYLRKPESLRLWLGLSEEYDKEVRDLILEEDDDDDGDDNDEGNSNQEEGYKEEEEDVEDVPIEAPPVAAAAVTEEEAVDEEIVSDGVKRLGSVERPIPPPPTTTVSEELKNKEVNNKKKNQTNKTVVKKKKEKTVTPLSQRVKDDPNLQLKVREMTIESEPYKTARAACGTLACVASDSELIQALYTEKCVHTFVKLLHSELPELVHRVLVILVEILSTPCPGLGKQLLEGGLVQGISVVLKMNDTTLGTLARDVANLLSSVVSAESKAEKKDTNTQ